MVKKFSSIRDPNQKEKERIWDMDVSMMESLSEHKVGEIQIRTPDIVGVLRFDERYRVLGFGRFCVRVLVYVF